jgi:hypothetical protein
MLFQNEVKVVLQLQRRCCRTQQRLLIQRMQPNFCCHLSVQPQEVGSAVAVLPAWLMCGEPAAVCGHWPTHTAAVLPAAVMQVVLHAAARFLLVLHLQRWQGCSRHVLAMLCTVLYCCLIRAGQDGKFAGCDVCMVLLQPLGSWVVCCFATVLVC